MTHPLSISISIEPGECPVCRRDQAFVYVDNGCIYVDNGCIRCAGYFKGYFRAREIIYMLQARAEAEAEEDEW